MKSNRMDGVPRRLYAFSLVGFLFNLVGYVTQPIFTLYLLGLEATMLQIGVILSIQTLSIVVLRFPLTFVAQRIGYKRMILIGFFVRFSAAILYSLAPNYLWLYIIPVYEAIAIGSFFQLIVSIVSNMAPQERQGDALGRSMTLMLMGMFLGPIITSALVTIINFRQLFLFTTPLSILGMILFLYSARRMPGSRSVQEQQYIAERPGTFSSLRTLAKDRSVFILSAIRTAYFISNNMFTALFAIYAVEELKFSPSLIAFLFSIQGFITTFIQFPVGRIADSVGRRTVLLFTFSVIILDYVGMAVARDFISLFLLFAVFGACWGTRAVVEWSLLTSIVPRETKTIAVSYLENYSYIGGALGSLLAGVTAGTVSFSTIFLIAAFVNIPTIPFVYFMGKQNQKTNESNDAQPASNNVIRNRLHA